MKNVLTLLALVFLLTSCTASPDDQRRVFDNENHVAVSGQKWTVKSLKQDYKNKTGDELIVTDALACGWDGDCYYNKYASAYDKGINNLNKKIEIEALKKEQQCQADVNCMKEREIYSAIESLNYSYRVVMAQNPYFQSDLDASLRQVCRRAGEAQRNWLSLNQVKKNLDLVEGIAPNDRIMIKRVASSCWVLSKNGISDGTTKIIIGD
ncbi:hypothetical protein [Lonsdalea quercina]|uniref:hypothetical protein n=1 Tax=Lonsdalea quercina TaxID=71657 RepID=UPI0039764EDB